MCVQGNNAHDEQNTAAVFQDQASSASFVSAARVVDAVSLLPGCNGEQADGVKAYTQSLLYNSKPGDQGHVDTWVMLPEDQWPTSWNGKFSRPVVRLRLALYGHPLACAFWGRHSKEAILSVGFQPIPDWDGVFVHLELQLVLSV